MSGTSLGIPASQIVSVTPGVISAGGTALDLIGLLLTTSTRPPIGQVLSFPSTSAVSAYFGPTALETTLAGVYFNGFLNSNKKPGAFLISQYVWQNPVPAYLRGVNLSNIPLATFQAITSGNVTITINGNPLSSSFNFAAATSLSNVALLVSKQLFATWGALSFSGTGSIAGNILTVSAVTTGTIHVNDGICSGTGMPIGAAVLNQLSGTAGGVGTYTISVSQSASSTSFGMYPGSAQFDPISSAIVVTVGGATPATTTITYAADGNPAQLGCALLGFTQASGGVISQGSALSTPSAAMSAITAITDNWCSFTTTFEPVVADKEAFALWTNQQNNSFLYACWSSNAASTQTGGPAPEFLAITAAGYSGTAEIYETDGQGQVATFVMGAIASIDFGEIQGRATLAFKNSPGIAAQVTNQTQAAYLNGYNVNYYGVWDTANDQFTFLYPGAVSGQFLWIDAYVNQIWMSNAFQLALMVLLTQVKSIPYNSAGYALIEAACADVINQAVNFGAIQPGVALSAAQTAEVNASAGKNIAPTISQRGWYLQVNDPGAQVRAARGSPQCTFWYADGGAVQRIQLASIDVQ